MRPKPQNADLFHKHSPEPSADPRGTSVLRQQSTPKRSLHTISTACRSTDDREETHLVSSPRLQYATQDKTHVKTHRHAQLEPRRGQPAGAPCLLLEQNTT